MTKEQNLLHIVNSELEMLYKERKDTEEVLTIINNRRKELDKELKDTEERINNLMFL